MLVKQAEWDEFYKCMLKSTGLDLNKYKANQLQRRIVSMATHKNFKSLSEFWKWLAQDKANSVWFCDRLAINVSELFRNGDKWSQVEKEIIPELLKTSTSLKIWSAGCSYGAEAHSLAMILDQNFSGRHSIIGTDIDEEALAQAKRGEFSVNDVRGVPAEYKRAYLEMRDGTFFATAQLRKYLSFKKQNLLADRFDRGFDLIMCRNVVIYFTEEAKAELYQKFFDALRPGGYLFVGSTERIFKANEIGFETEKPFFYKKPMLGKNKWQNAS